MIRRLFLQTALSGVLSFPLLQSVGLGNGQNEGQRLLQDLINQHKPHNNKRDACSIPSAPGPSATLLYNIDNGKYLLDSYEFSNNYYNIWDYNTMRTSSDVEPVHITYFNGSREMVEFSENKCILSSQWKVIKINNVTHTKQRYDHKVPNKLIIDIKNNDFNTLYKTIIKHYSKMKNILQPTIQYFDVGMIGFISSDLFQSTKDKCSYNAVLFHIRREGLVKLL